MQNSRLAQDVLEIRLAELSIAQESQFNSMKKRHSIEIKISNDTRQIQTIITTTWQCNQTLKREFCWFCTFAAKTRKSPLLVVTTGFSGIL